MPYLRSTEQSGEFAQRYHKVVKHITHVVVSRDHGTFPATTKHRIYTQQTHGLHLAHTWSQQTHFTFIRHIVYTQQMHRSHSKDACLALNRCKSVLKRCTVYTQQTRDLCPDLASFITQSRHCCYPPPPQHTPNPPPPPPGISSNCTKHHGSILTCQDHGEGLWNHSPHLRLPTPPPLFSRDHHE